MSLWGNRDQANNAPKHKNIVAPSAARGNTVYANTTLEAFIEKEVVGLYGAATTEANNAAGIAHTGWVLAKQGTGPVLSISVGANTGANFANGETVKASGGLTNASGVITSNSTGGLSSISLSSGGLGFVNDAAVTMTFNREKHLANVTVTGVTAAFDNTDVVTVSNGAVNAAATLSTNSTGGIDNTSFTVTTVGLFGNTQANSAAVVTVNAANGTTSNGTGATFSVNLSPSVNGNTTFKLGGRANRIQYETIVATGSIQNNATGSLGI